MLCPSVGKGHDSQPWLSLLLGCAAIWINVSNAPSLVEVWWSAPAHRSVVVEHHFPNHATSVMLKFPAQDILFTYLAFLPRCRFRLAVPEGASLPCLRQRWLEICVIPLFIIYVSDIICAFLNWLLPYPFSLSASSLSWTSFYYFCVFSCVCMFVPHA